MRIAIDLTSTPRSKMGIGRYMLGLLEGLQKVDRENEYFLYAQDDDLDGFGVDAPNMHFVPVKSKILRKTYLRILWEQIVFPFRLRRARIDVLQCPNYTMPYPIRLISPKTAVVSDFHDMAYFMFPELYIGWKNNMFKWYIKRTARHADKIITISKNSREDIPKYCNPRNKDIAVTYMGATGDFYNGTPAGEEILSKYKIEGDYIYNVGTLQPRKNVSGLIDGYRLLPDEIRDKYKLVITGKKGWSYDEFFSKVNKDPKLRDNVRFTGFVDDADMIPLMRRASVFAYVSFYEGFGIPVIEGMAAGVPVVTSDNSSLKEIAEGYGFLCDPHDASSISKALSDAIKLSEAAKAGDRAATERIEIAREHAKIYNWASCAEETVKAYREAYDRRHKSAK